MRISSIEVSYWRQFRDIIFTIPSDAPLVCLVGENGSGKSSILELISSLSVHVGISPGTESVRGDALAETHAVKATFEIPGYVTEADSFRTQAAQWPGALEGWSGSVSIESIGSNGHRETILKAEGVDATNSTNLAHLAIGTLQQDNEIHYVYLDADRSYPQVAIQPHEYAEALARRYTEPQEERQWSYRRTSTLYSEWIKYCLGVEGQAAFSLSRQLRRGKTAEEAALGYIDPFASYKAALESVLPAVSFIGPDEQTRTLLFDTNGIEISFDNLSGGEREIAFLVGQLERFKLRRGLLLIDEPELHLNPDLLRVWLGYLRDSITEGQVWVATHSLEAVEVASRFSTFVVNKDKASRLTHSVSALDDRPALALLSGAVGSPAFSIANLKFVYIEGERGAGERDRFHKLVGSPASYRFMEGGGCKQVERNLKVAKQLALETAEHLAIGAIVDLDCRTLPDVDRLEREGLHVLGVHEVENFFLQPELGRKFCERNAGNDYAQILKRCADRFAGLWILRAAAQRVDLDAGPAARSLASAMTWQKISEDLGKFLTAIESATPATDSAYSLALSLAVKAYASLRESDNLWKYCMGKQVLNVIPVELGLNNSQTLERQALSLWASDEVTKSDELMAMISYIESVSP